MIAPDSNSFPCLGIAQRFGVDYGDVLQVFDGIRPRGAGRGPVFERAFDRLFHHPLAHEIMSAIKGAVARRSQGGLGHWSVTLDDLFAVFQSLIMSIDQRPNGEWIVGGADPEVVCSDAHSALQACLGRPALPFVQDAITSTVRRVSEYDDRTSPADWPEALLITAEELARELQSFASEISPLISDSPAVFTIPALDTFTPEERARLTSFIESNKGRPGALVLPAPADDSAQLRAALQAHHDWHLSQTDEDQHGIIPAEAYSESSLCDRTSLALRGDAPSPAPADGEAASLRRAIADIAARTRQQVDATRHYNRISCGSQEGMEVSTSHFLDLAREMEALAGVESTSPIRAEAERLAPILDVTADRAEQSLRNLIDRGLVAELGSAPAEPWTMPRITVWKNGTWKLWAAGDAQLAEGEPDWLATIDTVPPSAPCEVEAALAALEEAEAILGGEYAHQYGVLFNRMEELRDALRSRAQVTTGSPLPYYKRGEETWPTIWRMPEGDPDQADLYEKVATLTDDTLLRTALNIRDNCIVRTEDIDKGIIAGIVSAAARFMVGYGVNQLEAAADAVRKTWLAAATQALAVQHLGWEALAETTDDGA